jgi:3' terminal RNA ribose 2'-O-methyltransferase Hen1
LCLAGLLVRVDQARLTNGPGGDSRGAAQGATDATNHVNDRPYVASSLLSVALGRVFSSALNGRCKTRPELVEQAMPLRASLPLLPARRGGEDLLRELFEPLGYDVQTQRLPLDERFPDWGPSPYFAVELSATTRLRSLLGHLYTLIPVLDDEKHYWVGQDELEKLLQRGEGWLAEHPAKQKIADRYLRRLPKLTRQALSRLSDESHPAGDPDAQAHERQQREDHLERPLSLHEQRHEAVVSALRAAGAKSVLDLGCSEGRLMLRLARESSIHRLVGVDVSLGALERAEKRLSRAGLLEVGGVVSDEVTSQRVALRHGSLLYRDARLEGFDAACLVEVIEHLDEPRLASAERCIFAHAKPRTVILTTPNAEYNALFEGLPAGALRHADHRFEWTREQFRSWAQDLAKRHGYAVALEGVGPADPDLGCPTQMAVFTRLDPSRLGPSRLGPSTQQASANPEGA